VREEVEMLRFTHQMMPVFLRTYAVREELPTERGRGGKKKEGKKSCCDLGMMMIMLKYFTSL
jgi:hypothetical protein